MHILAHSLLELPHLLFIQQLVLHFLGQIHSFPEWPADGIVGLLGSPTYTLRECLTCNADSFRRIPNSPDSDCRDYQQGEYDISLEGGAEQRRPILEMIVQSRNQINHFTSYNKSKIIYLLLRRLLMWQSSFYWVRCPFSILIIPADLKSMQSTSALRIARQIPTNITSSLALSPDGRFFATYTRQLSTVSSQWIYRLEYYSFDNFTKLGSQEVYQSYNTDKHMMTFVPAPGNSSLIALSTVNNLIFYTAAPITKVASFLHKQANVYDLAASPDGKLTVLVGQTIVIYRNNGFTPVVFPQVIENARYCDFSLDGIYMVIASTSTLNVYTYQRSNGDYLFNPVPLNSTAPVAYGAITSVQFNPVNSSELVVGFLSSSPMAYSLVNAIFFKKIQDIQPSSSQNAKIARYMSDGMRYYSYDYLDGVGLWPGRKIVRDGIVEYRLDYTENMLLYDAAPNPNGTILIGAVWQSIKVAYIVQSTCQQPPSSLSTATKDKKTEGNSSLLITCYCPSGSAYSYANFQCQKLQCRQAEYATGVVKGNVCECIAGFIFDQVTMKCRIDCSIIPEALSTQPNPYECYCGNNHSWNAMTRKCEFKCSDIPYSTGVAVSTNQCACLTGFIWSNERSECVCPSFMQPLGGSCICINNYYVDQASNRCLANCSLISGTISTTPNGTGCTCEAGSYYTVKSGEAGCQLNCTAIRDTIQEGGDFSTCICHEHMDWFNNTCVVDCAAIVDSDPSGQVNNTCGCAINYLWIDKIKECARNCTGVKYTVPGADSTLISCPCIQNFAWNEANTRCEVQCGMIPNSQDYSLAEVNQCDCRPGFNWNPSNYSCQVDCSQIWNAGSRINDSFCNCQNDMPFNNQTLTCQSAAASGLFSNTLSIVGFAVGIVIVLIIAVILVKFCWGFSTESNKESEKKIKMRDSTKKKGGLVRGKQKVDLEREQEPPKTTERFVSPRKTTTNTTL